MNVKELIKQLSNMPPEMDVVIWDDVQDDYVPVTYALFEDGATDIALETGEVPDLIPACPDDGHAPAECPLGTCSNA